MIDRKMVTPNKAYLWLKLNRWECLLAGMIFIAFGIFLITLSDYGASYDEPILYEYADRMVDAYKKLAFGENIDPLLDFYDLPYYGPAYLIIGRLAIAMIHTVVSGLEIYNAWHIINFATFLTGCMLVYILTRRIASKPASFIAAMLYLTQPLLWGHGAMNPKDGPFMTAFLAVMVTGMKMVDVFNHPPPDQGTSVDAKLRWSGGRRAGIIIGLIIGVIILADRVFGNFLLIPVIQKLLTFVRTPSSDGWIHPFIQKIFPTTSAVPFADYFSKALKSLNFAEFVILVGIGLTGLIFILRKSPSKIRWLLLAGILSGVAMAIRVLGPAAAGLAVSYAIMGKTKNWWKPALGYVGMTMAVTYALWPFLWDSPVSSLLESARLMAAFPWIGTVRFEGSNFLAGDLPFYYLPKLMSIQFTVPLLGLALAGTILLFKKGIEQAREWETGIIMLTWFWAPVLIVMVLQPNSYDNFRQFLFIIPPLFVMAGVAVDAIGRWVRQSGVRAILVGAGLLPGMIAGFWLHPYEYVYYNALVGWTGSVERRYETDYWGTSMCEAGKFVSDQSSQVALVVLNDEILRRLFERCSTQTLDIRLDSAETLGITPDFAVFLSRFDHDQTYYRDLESLLAVQRGKTIFAVVKGNSEYNPPE